MRGAVCGMVTPGNPYEAARLAWMDGVVSHCSNGVLGEIFNAVLTALSFTYEDVKEIIEKTVKLIPEDSEYYSVVSFALNECKTKNDWESAWRECEKKYEEYNWIHAYPNAAAEVIALWFGNGDFDETMHIIAMEGQDVDCNAAQIGTVIGIIKGVNGIDEKWIEPIGDDLDTYIRGMKKAKISKLSEWTVAVTRLSNNR
jgi:ADP-ribosylglycohydrolase